MGTDKKNTPSVFLVPAGFIKSFDIDGIGFPEDANLQLSYSSRSSPSQLWSTALDFRHCRKQPTAWCSALLSV